MSRKEKIRVESFRAPMTTPKYQSSSSKSILVAGGGVPPVRYVVLSSNMYASGDDDATRRDHIVFEQWPIPRSYEVVAGYWLPVFFVFRVSPKPWAVDAYICVRFYIYRELAGGLGGLGGLGVENLVFDFAHPSGAPRTSHFVGVEYGVLLGCVWRFG